MPSSLPPDLAQFVEQEIALGKYQSEVEVLCEGLRLLKEREVRLEALRKEILPALERLDRGEGIELDDESLRELAAGIKADGRKRLEERRNQRNGQ